MKKTNKILLTSVVMLSSLGLVSALNAKDTSLGGLKFTADVAGEKVSVGKKGAHVATDMPAGEFVTGTSTRVSNAVVQKSTRNNATSLRFIAAVKANTVTADKLEIGGELGFHVKAGEANKNIIVDYVYNSVNASSKTYKANELSSAKTELAMADFLKDTGMKDNGYNLFMVLEFTNISDALINTAFEVQPFFVPASGKVEYSAGTKEAKATGVTATVGNKTVFMEKIAKDDKVENMVEQYKLVTDVKKGDTLSFAVEGAKITNIGSGDGKGNNISKDLVVLQDATAAEIYLKKYENGGYDVWVTGYKEDDPVAKFDTYLYGSMNGWKPDEKYGLVANPENETERMITVDLKAEDTFKIYYEGNKDRDSYYGMGDVKAGCLDLLDGDNNISVKEDGKYSFYFSTTPDANADNKYIWIAKESTPAKLGNIEGAVINENNGVYTYACAQQGDGIKYIIEYMQGDVVVATETTTNGGTLTCTSSLKAGKYTVRVKAIDSTGAHSDSDYTILNFEVKEATPEPVGAEVKFTVIETHGDHWVKVKYETTANLDSRAYVQVNGKQFACNNVAGEANTLDIWFTDETGYPAGDYVVKFFDGTGKVFAQGTFTITDETPEPVGVEVKFTVIETHGDHWVKVKYETTANLDSRAYVQVNGKQFACNNVAGEANTLDIWFTDETGYPAGDYVVKFYDGTGKVFAHGTITIEEKKPDPVTTGATIKVGTAEAVAMKDVSDYDKNGDTWDKQYEVKVSVKAGDELVFAINGTAITENIGPGTGDNNLKLENGKLIVINDADATVYFKIYPNGGHSVHVTGLDKGNTGDDPVTSFDTYLYGSMNGWKQDEKYGLTTNPGKATERMITLELKAEDTFKIYYEGNKDRDSYYGMGDVKAGCLELLDGTNDISVKEDGKYTFYFSTVADGGKYIWIEKAGSTNTDVTEDPVAEKITLYYKQDNNTATPKVYFWGGKEAAPSWPGLEMKKVEGTDNVYMLEIPGDSKNCIFCYTGDADKTANLTIPTDGKNYYHNGNWETYEG